MKRVLQILCFTIAFSMLICGMVACKKGGEPTDDTIDTTEEQPNTGGEQSGDGGEGDGGEKPTENPLDKPTDGGYYVFTEEIDATLISFNMEMKYNETERAEAVAKFLCGQNASVICLQEVWENYVSTLETGLAEKYGVLYKSLQSGRAEGLVIAYDKEEWKLVSENRFWLSETPEVKSKSWNADSYAICFNVVLEHIDTGAMLHVFNSRLDEVSEKAREEGMKLIASRIAASNYPVFLGCDFNATNASAVYGFAEAVLADCQRVAGADTGVTYHQDRTVTGGASTDFCFVSNDRVSTESLSICRDKYGENGELFLSDHYALKAEVKILFKRTGRPDATEHGFDGVTDAAKVS